MKKNLILVESPNKIKKIQSFLDDKQFKVMATVGHVRDLSNKGAYGLGVELETMHPTYKIPRDKREVIKEIKRAAEDSSIVYLATDPDREGEAISWHIKDLIANQQITKEFNLDLIKDIKFYRIVFNEITKEAVLEAINHPRDIDMNLVHSQETRRILDRMIGFRLSSFAKSKIYARSVGRVKSVALKLIIEREKEINKFKPEFWYTVQKELKDDVLVFNVDKDLNEIKYKTKQEADNLLKKLGKDFNFTKREEKLIKVNPPKPFEMATFLMAMYSKFGMSNAQSTFVSQFLYEKGLITYPRTDSIRISSQSFIQSLEEFISNRYGKNLFQKPNLVKNDNSQDAHEAIRPSDINLTPELSGLKGNELKAYKHIWETTIKSFLPAGTNISVKDIYENNKELFVIKKTFIKDLGFRVVDEKIPKEDQEIIKTLNIKELDVIEHQSKPPARYNFASLIKTLKEDGVGRPSTYSATTTGLIKFNYVTSEKGVFKPTELGFEVDTLIQKDFNDLINEKYTSKLEQDLDLIAEGKMKEFDFLKDFWDKFSARVEDSSKTTEAKVLEEVGRNCPECGGKLIYRWSRFGKFISCENFPTCKYSESLVKKEPPKEVGRNCPQCEKPLIIRKSRFGSEFIGCSGYPNCKHAEFPEKEKTDKKPRAKTKKS